jgi:hypothetical protein
MESGRIVSFQTNNILWWIDTRMGIDSICHSNDTTSFGGGDHAAVQQGPMCYYYYRYYY